MRYTVVRNQDAQDELGQLWIDAGNKKEIAQAADRIDWELLISPVEKGEPFGDKFHLIEEPLEIIYKVSEDDRLVTVLQVCLLE
jgi:hypothetical protein